MSETLPVVYLVRHGETEWSRSLRHTGRVDLPLTEEGEQEARRVGARLTSISFTRVFTSPLQRASRTCELAGYQAVAEVDPDLMEWDYGKYEGRRRTEILAARPDWRLFRDGCPGGESPEDVARRADQVIGRVREVSGDVLLFSSGHLLRVLAARWMESGPLLAEHLLLSTASLSALGYEHDRSRPVIRLWNEISTKTG